MESETGFFDDHIGSESVRIGSAVEAPDEAQAAERTRVATATSNPSFFFMANLTIEPAVHSAVRS